MDGLIVGFQNLSQNKSAHLFRTGAIAVGLDYCRSEDGRLFATIVAQTPSHCKMLSRKRILPQPEQGHKDDAQPHQRSQAEPEHECQRYRGRRAPLFSRRCHFCLSKARTETQTGSAYEQPPQT